MRPQVGAGGLEHRIASNLGKLSAYPVFIRVFVRRLGSGDRTCGLTLVVLTFRLLDYQCYMAEEGRHTPAVADPVPDAPKRAVS